jgi:hypothetical protein
MQSHTEPVRLSNGTEYTPRQYEQGHEGILRYPNQSHVS